jgi:hypothetical protein
MSRLEEGASSSPTSAPQTSSASPHTTYHELWRMVEALREMLDTAEHLRLAAGRDLVA